MSELLRLPETAYRMAMASARGLLMPVCSQLLDRIGSEEAFFSLSEGELTAICGFSSRIFSKDHRAALLERAAREYEYVEAHGIDTLYFRDDRYPARLLQCDDAPLMLYGFGHGDCLNGSLTLSIVGTRHATAYGVDWVRQLVQSLAERCARRVVIVSGLAFGIDITAHRAALDAGLPTVAVLAHGLNTIYPAQHRQTAVDIVRKGGALLTEYTSADPVHKGNFLARNRIVAGMADATIVVESATKGGAMVTARIAGAYSRDVFALPGRTSDPWSAGCNQLISRNQAALLTDADALIEAMGWPAVTADTDHPSLFNDVSPDESALIEWLADHPDSQLNDIAVALDMPQGRLNGVLLELEYKDLILRKPGARYCTK